MSVNVIEHNDKYIVQIDIKMGLQSWVFRLSSDSTKSGALRKALESICDGEEQMKEIKKEIRRLDNPEIEKWRYKKAQE